jgi:hypothetical protein
MQMPQRWEIMNYRELLKGCEAYVKNEPRDAMYKVATQILAQFWGEPSEMADGLGVLLLTWNQAFYRYGAFDFGRLEECIRKWWTQIQDFRNRKIQSFSEEDIDVIKKLFTDFLFSLRKKDGAMSPVAVAKALHLLAPHFFPLWDDEISKAYRCYWYDPNRSPDKYIEFMKRIKSNVDMILQSYIEEQRVDDNVAENSILKLHPNPKPYLTILKLIDEYNYSKYSKGWI